MPGPHRVVFVTPEGEVELPAEEDRVLLEAAAEAGLALPSTCRQGWCISCAGRLEAGRADQSEALRLYPEDEAEGFVLLCSAYARSALRIRTHQREAMRDHRRRHGLPAPGA